MWPTNSRSVPAETSRIAAVLVVLAIESGPCASQDSLPTEKQAVTAQVKIDEELSFVDQLAAVEQGSATQIWLRSRAIGDQDLLALKPHFAVRTLLLDAGNLSDQSGATLGRLEHLVHLRIRQSDLGDEFAKQLAQRAPAQLQVLNLPQAQLTAQGIRELRKLPQLRQLRLGGGRFDDSAAAELSKLEGLKSLHLIGPKISDRGLVELSNIKGLASLYIDDCPLSDEAWAALFDRHPNLHVHIDQQHHDRDPKREHNER